MLEILSSWINEPLTQSLLLSPIMGVLFAVIFAGFTSSPTTSSPRTIERTTVIYRERIVYKNGNNNNNTDDGREIIVVVGIGLLFIIWQYAANANILLYYLAVFILTSLVFCLTTMVISFLKGQFTDEEWWYYTFAPLVFLGVSSYLLGVAKEHISPELIQAAQSAKNPISFYFSTLTTYGRRLMIMQTLGVICLFLLTLSSSAVLIHYLSLMNQRTEGPFRWLWDILVRLTKIASGNTGFILCTIFTLLSWILIDGIILNMIMQ